MKRGLLLKSTAFFIAILLSTQICFAQQAPPAGADAGAEQPIPQLQLKPPVMKSIFWNTLLGSLWGFVLGGSYSLIGPPGTNNTEALIVGTTIGGVLGYGFGIFFVIRGLSFDEQVLPKIGNSPVRAQLYQPWLDPNQPIYAQDFHKGDYLDEEPEWKWRTTLIDVRF